MFPHASWVEARLDKWLESTSTWQPVGATSEVWLCDPVTYLDLKALC